MLLRESAGTIGRGVALLLGAWLLIAASVPDLRVTGRVFYGKAEGARSVGVVDIRVIYASNPAFLRMKAFGLSETDGGRGQHLFDESQVAARHALARIATDNGLDVITQIGGVSGAQTEPVDFTQQVIDALPHFYVEGKLLHGNVRGARSIAEIDSQTLLAAIPSYIEWLGSDPSEARYHILKKDYEDKFGRAVRQSARDAGADVIVEKGAATSRHGELKDVTSQAVSVLAQ